MDIITKKSIWWMMSSIHGVLQQSKLLIKQPYRSNMMNNMFDEDRNSKQHKTDHCNSPSRRFRQTTIFKFISHGSKSLFCWCSALKIPPKKLRITTLASSWGMLSDDQWTQLTANSPQSVCRNLSQLPWLIQNVDKRRKGNRERGFLYFPQGGR